MTIAPGTVGDHGVLGPPLALAEGVGALTMAGFLAEVAGRHGPAEALVFDDPLMDGATARWSYDDLHRNATRVALGLLEDGVRPGDRVGILMGNRPEAVSSVFGAAIAGAVPVMLSTFAPLPELVPMLVRADVTVLLTQSELLTRLYVDEMILVADRLPQLRNVFAVGEPSWDDLLVIGLGREDELPDPPAPDAGDRSEGLIIFSSGTTSEPKGIVHDHRSPVLQFWLQARIFRRDASTRMWASMPMFWTAGLNSAMGATLAAGGCWVMQETFEPGAALALLERERVTEPYSLPHQTAALAEHPDWTTTDLSSLRCVFGKSAFARHPSVDGDTTWNNPVGYGLSETCAFFSAHDASTPRELLRASHGRLLPGNELRVLDEATGLPVGPGVDGELAIRGETLFLRYLGHAEGEDLDADGFFHTGDIGHYDDDGDLHWVGRRTELIKTGGANVAPAEVEVQLNASPDVKVARVVGVPDDRLGELVVACITPVDGVEGTDEVVGRITSFLRERLASYKVPKHLLFFADGEIPMTAGGSKVRDPELAALVATRLGPHDPDSIRGAP